MIETDSTKRMVTRHLKTVAEHIWDLEQQEQRFNLIDLSIGFYERDVEEL